jgi:type I restriction enzyme M protein
VERPLRLRVELSLEQLRRFRLICEEADEAPLANLLDDAAEQLGTGPHNDFNRFIERLRELAEGASIKLTAKREKLLQNALAERDETAEPVIRRIHNKE